MLVRQFVGSAASVSLTAAALGVAALVFSAPSAAIDIAWRAKGEAAVWNGANYERKGTIVFKAAETGSFVSYGTNHPAEKGLTPFVSQYILRFEDLSSISISMAGNFDPATRVATGSGQILSGTGRFEGIAGKVSVISRFGDGSAPDMEWTGTYSLPADLRASQ